MGARWFNSNARMHEMKKLIIIYLISGLQLMAIEYRSKIAYMIAQPDDLLYGTIVFTNGKDTVAFKSEKAQNILLYGKIPERKLLQSFSIDISKWKDMKSVAFGELSPSQRKLANREYDYYVTSKEYASRIYFLNASSKETEYFIYYEVIEKQHGMGIDK